MGIEYHIRYRPPDLNEWTAFVSRLSNPTVNGWPAFAIESQESGIYFCDHGRSEAAAIALRRIIDEALTHGRFVAVEAAE